jgi:protein-tyrosine phosphatase
MTYACMVDSVIILCTGNVCRSPMALGLLRHAVQVSGQGLQVDSAGLAALSGERPDPIAIRLLAERGIDISDHIAKQARIQLLRRYALILTMERAQQQLVERTWPRLVGRVFRWGLAQNIDVPDPYGQEEQSFRESLAVIDQDLGTWVRYLGIGIHHRS